MKKAFAAIVVIAAVAAAQQLPAALDSVYRQYSVGEHAAALARLERLEPLFPRGNDNFVVRLEIGDCLLDKLGDCAAAESVYTGLLADFPRDRRVPDVMYRLALAQEMQEKYLDAAQNYEKVATQYMKSTYGTDALDAIERCFRKNYQERVAYVNGYPITRIELDDLISRNPAFYEPFEKKQALLDTMIERRLIHEAALAAGLDRDTGYTRPRAETRNRAVFEEWYARTVTDRAEPTEKELQALYRQDRAAKYTTPEKVHAYQILVADKAKADSLYRALLADTTLVWDSVAAEHSIAPDRLQGGDLGMFARGVQQKEIENAAFRMKPGQVGAPVKTADGWVILRVTEKKPTYVKPFEEARSQLASQLRQENTTRLYEEATARLKAAATLVVDSTAIEENRPVLAVVDGVDITRVELDARLNAIPPMFRAQFQTPEGMQRILEQLILERLLLLECERQKTWLWNRVVDKLLTQDERMLQDIYRRRMVVERVSVDSAEMMAEYQATIAEFKVPARVRAREIVAPTRARADQLRRWAVAGRLPELLAGRALLVPPAADAAAAREALASTGNTDSLVGSSRLADPPVLVAGAPVVQLGAARVTDLGRPSPLTGPYHGGTFGFAFNDLSSDDPLYRPDLEYARDAAGLSQLRGVQLPVDSAGNPVVDTLSYGAYVRLAERLGSGFAKGLFGLEPGTVAEPLALESGVLLVKVTKLDSAGTATFADIAKKFSTAGSRWNGGDMNWLSREDKSRDEKVIDAAFGLAVDGTSPVIKLSDSSFIFIRVEEKEKAYTRPFSEVKDKLEAKLRRDRELALYEGGLQSLTDGANIEIVMKESDFIFESELPEEPGAGEVPPVEPEQ